MVHTHMWYVRGYVLGEEGVNASTSRGRNSKLEGQNIGSKIELDWTCVFLHTVFF
jgi:hypothetical protein